MWMMTKHGFYSIVEKEADTFHVRSREKLDLENLVNRVPLEGIEIHESDVTDYRFRVIVNRDTVLSILMLFGKSLDYNNFKGQIDSNAEQAHKPYHEVWDVMATALGSYGRPGKTRNS